MIALGPPFVETRGLNPIPAVIPEIAECYPGTFHVRARYVHILCQMATADCHR